MKSTSNSFYLTITLALCLSIFAVGNTDAQMGDYDIPGITAVHQAKLTTLRADIKISRYNFGLNETDISEGNLLYLPPKKETEYIRIDWLKPVQEYDFAANSKYQYIPSRRTTINFVGKSFASERGNELITLLGLISADPESLTKTYSLKYLGEEMVDNKSTWHNKLTPKASTDIKALELWADKNGMVIQIKLTKRNDDMTIITLSNLRKNMKMDKSLFRIRNSKEFVKG